MSEPAESKPSASGYTGDSGATGDSGSKADKKPDPPVRSSTPENAAGKLNPSAPGNAGTTPGTNADNG